MKYVIINSFLLSFLFGCAVVHGVENLKVQFESSENQAIREGIYRKLPSKTIVTPVKKHGAGWVIQCDLREADCIRTIQPLAGINTFMMSVMSAVGVSLLIPQPIGSTCSVMAAAYTTYLGDRINRKLF